MISYTLRGYLRLTKLSVAKLWQAVYLCVYALVYGITSLAKWIWRKTVLFASISPRTFICIVCMALVTQYSIMSIRYSVIADKQNRRYDSLWFVKDSIERNSSFDCGYAKGINDAYILKKDNTNGHQEEEGTIR